MKALTLVLAALLVGVSAGVVRADSLVGMTINQSEAVVASPKGTKEIVGNSEPESVSGTAAALYNEGGRLLELGQYAEASRAFEQAVRLKPGSALLHNDLGYSYFLGGRYSDAVIAYQQAIKLQPNFALAYNNLASPTCDSRITRMRTCF